MSSIKINIPHQLSQEEALKRVKGLIGKFKTELGDSISNVSEEWEGETGQFGFSARGFDISGLIRVNDTSLDIDAKVPFAVSLFKGKIKQVIQEKASELLSP
jgi:hypothetical protein